MKVTMSGQKLNIVYFKVLGCWKSHFIVIIVRANTEDGIYTVPPSGVSHKEHYYMCSVGDKGHKFT